MILSLFTNPQFLGVYIVSSFIVAVVSSNRKLGFWGGFLLSMLLTPLIMILVLNISGTRKQYQKK